MIKLLFQRQNVTILVILASLLFLFVYVAFSTGPLAPVPATLITVKNEPLSPSLYGIGTIEARYNYKIGSTFTGRLKQLNVDVGDYVKLGHVLGEIDPVDLDKHISAQDASINGAQAQLTEAMARHNYAKEQAKRYEELLEVKSTSKEIVAAKKQELIISQASLSFAQENIRRLKAEKDALVIQRNSLRLISPVNGLVVKRNAEPGSTVIAGQPVVEIIDPKTLWINARFDQIRATGLRAGLPAHMKLKSRPKDLQNGHVLYVEPLADAITEEILAKIIFEQIPDPLPPIGELVEVIVNLPKLPPKPIIPNAAIKQKEGQLGVWRYSKNKLLFTPITVGASNLEGNTQVISGLKEGDKIVVYSKKALTAQTKIHIVEQISGELK